MDKSNGAEKDSSELARELLIAISESEPDKVHNLTDVDEKSKTLNGTELTKETDEDRLREDLISISDSPSPDKLTGVPGV